MIVHDPVELREFADRIRADTVSGIEAVFRVLHGRLIVSVDREERISFKGEITMERCSTVEPY